MDGKELRESLVLQMEEEMIFQEKMRPAEHPTEPNQDNRAILMAKRTAADWRVVETNRSLGYNGLSKGKRQDDAKKARDEEEVNKIIRNSSVKLVISIELSTHLHLPIPRASSIKKKKIQALDN